MASAAKVLAVKQVLARNGWQKRSLDEDAAHIAGFAHDRAALASYFHRQGYVGKDRGAGTEAEQYADEVQEKVRASSGKAAKHRPAGSPAGGRFY